MIYQIHHEFKDGTTEMMCQFEVKNGFSSDDFRAIMKETREAHPLPGGAQWLLLEESDPRFWVTDGIGVAPKSAFCGKP